MRVSVSHCVLAICALAIGLFVLQPGIAAAQNWATPPVPGPNMQGPNMQGPGMQVLPPPYGNPPAGAPGGELIIPNAGDIQPPEELLEVLTPATPVISPINWDRSLELGVSGSSGNTQVFNLRTATHLERESDLQKSTFDLTYRKSEADGAETSNLLFTEGRNEWNFPDNSCWSVFIHGTGEYDEFRDYNVRLTADTGLGYYFVRNDVSKLQGRFGGGFSHEIGGMDESYVPEAAFGMEASHQLTPRSKLTAKADYFPDVSDFGDFRLNSSANWEILMDEVLDVSLKLGIIDRYDSTPGGKKPNDLDYSAVLLWKF